LAITLAAAIVKGAEDRGLALAETRDFRSVTGKGVVGTIEGRRIAIGTPVLLTDEGVDGGDVRPERSLKLLLVGCGLQRSPSIGFRLAVDRP